VAGFTTQPRVGHAAALLADGRVLIVGAIARPYPIGRDTSAEIFDPVSGRFAPTTPMAEGRSYPTAIALADGGVLVLSPDSVRAEVYR
jgi:hypothetical protein